MQIRTIDEAEEPAYQLGAARLEREPDAYLVRRDVMPLGKRSKRRRDKRLHPVRRIG